MCSRMRTTAVTMLHRHAQARSVFPASPACLSLRYASIPNKPTIPLPPDADRTPSDSPTDSVPPPPGPASRGLLDKVLGAMRREAEEVEKGPDPGTRLGSPNPATEAPPKPGFLTRIYNRIDQERRTLETQELAKRDAGQSARITPQTQQRMSRLLDADQNLKERDELLREAFQHGYFDDYKEVARKGAKLWDAPKRIRAQNVSPLVPNVRGATMDGTETDLLSLVSAKKVSLVTFVFNGLGVSHVDSFRHTFQKEFGNTPNVQVVQVQVEENPFKAPLVRLFKPFLRTKIPLEERPTYLLHFNSIQKARRDAGMTNAALGWVNLVDASGRVRWQAHGLAKDQEIVAMVEITRRMAGLKEVDSSHLKSR